MTRVHMLELSLAICFFMLGYTANGMIHRSFKVSTEGSIFAAVGVVLLVINWG